MNTFVNTAALQTAPAHFPLSSHPMWLLLLLVPRSSERSQVGPVPERAGGLHCSPPVHLIAYTQPLWPAPVHRANTAYILANWFFLDLQIEDVLQVAGSLTWTVFVDQLHRNKSEAFGIVTATGAQSLSEMGSFTICVKMIIALYWM